MSILSGGYGQTPTEIKPSDLGRGKTVIYRMPTNPMDRATIVSLLPFVIKERKPTIFPSVFEIPAAERGDFSLFIVEPSSEYEQNRSLGRNAAPLERQINAASLAQSIVLDYLNSNFRATGPNCKPGLFWIPGEYDRISILGFKDKASGKTFQQILVDEEKAQRAWFFSLIEAADVLWARSNGNPVAIPHEARLGAEIYGLKDKPWMKDHLAQRLEPCKFCGEMVDYNYPICKHCQKVINPERMGQLEVPVKA